MTDTSAPQPGSPQAPIELGPGTGEPAELAPPFDPADVPDAEPAALPSLADVLARFAAQPPAEEGAAEPPDAPAGLDSVSPPEPDAAGTTVAPVAEPTVLDTPGPVTDDGETSPTVVPEPAPEPTRFDETPLFGEPAPLVVESPPAPEPPVVESAPAAAVPASEEPAASTPMDWRPLFADPEPAPAPEPGGPAPMAPQPAPSPPDELVPVASAAVVEAAEGGDTTAAASTPPVADDPAPATREENAIPFDQDFLTPAEGVTIPPASPDDLEPVFLTAPRVDPAAVAQLGELNGKELGRRAVTVNDARIGKLEPGFGFGARFRSFAVLLIVTVVVAAAVAAVLAISVELISVWANHAISKSAGS